MVEKLVAGRAKDFESYKQAVGFIAGLDAVIEEREKMQDEAAKAMSQTNETGD